MFIERHTAASGTISTGTSYGLKHFLTGETYMYPYSGATAGSVVRSAGGTETRGQNTAFAPRIVAQ